MTSLLSREVYLYLEVRVRPDLHHGGFLQYLRDHSDHRDQLQQLSLGLRGEDFTIVSWEVNNQILSSLLCYANNSRK